MRNTLFFLWLNNANIERLFNKNLCEQDNYGINYKDTHSVVSDNWIFILLSIYLGSLRNRPRQTLVTAPSGAQNYIQLMQSFLGPKLEYQFFFYILSFFLNIILFKCVGPVRRKYQCNLIKTTTVATKYKYQNTRMCY